MASLQCQEEKSCTTHPGEPLKFYCTSHNIIVCSICAVKRHRQCNDVLTFAEAIERFEREDKNLFKALDNQGNAIDVVISFKNTEMGYLASSVDATKSAIDDVCERLHDVINNKKKELVKYVDELAGEEERKIKADISVLHNMLVSTGNAQKHAEHAFDKRSALGIIQTMVAVQNMYCDIDRAIDDVKHRPVQCISFQQSDEVRRITENLQTLGFISLNKCEGINEMDEGAAAKIIQPEPDINCVHHLCPNDERELDDELDFNFLFKENNIPSPSKLEDVAEVDTENVSQIQEGAKVKFVQFATDIIQIPTEDGFSMNELEFNCMFDETETSTEDDMDDFDEHMKPDNTDTEENNLMTDVVCQEDALDQEVSSETDGTSTHSEEIVTSFQTVDHGKPCWLYGITFITTDRLAVTDVAHDSLQVIDVEGTLVCETIVSFTPWDITSVEDGIIAVSAGGRGSIHIYQLKDENLSSTRVLHIGHDCVCLSYSENTFTIGTRSGVVIVTDEGDQVKEIDKYTNDGECIRRTHFVTTDTTKNTLFLTNTWRNDVVSINHEGQRSWALQREGLNPRGIVWHQNGLFVCSKSPGEILLVDDKGSIVKEIGSGKVELPYAIAHHRSSDMVAVTQWDENIDAEKSRVVKIVRLSHKINILCQLVANDSKNSCGK